MEKFIVMIGSQKIKLYSFITIIIFSATYALVINNLLPNTYSTGTLYEKNFSPGIFIFCIIDALFLYVITENTVSSADFIQSCTMRIIYWVYAIPMSLYPALFNPKYVWAFWLCFNIYWIIFCFLTPRIHFFGMKIRCLSYPGKIKKIVGIVSIITIIYLIINQLNGYHFSLSLGDVYGVRRDFKEQMSQNFLGVFKTIFGTYICPCLIVSFIKEKKNIYSLLFIFLQLVLFTMAKDKIMLVYLLIAIIIGALSENIFKKINIGKYFSLAILIVCGFNILAMNGVFTTITFTLVTRRMFMMPAWGNYLWFEFFTDNSKLWLHQDVFLIDKLFSPVYQNAAPAVIASSIGGSAYSYFNTGLMAESYSQLGIAGLVLGPVLLGFWLDFLNRFYKNKSLPIQFMLSFSISQAFINSTTIETGNIFIFIAIAAYSGVFLSVSNDPKSVHNGCL